MALARYPRRITDSAGNIVPGAQVTVQSQVGGGMPALFSDRDGLVQIDNPITADAKGRIAFHVRGGAYRITATDGELVVVDEWVGIGTAQEWDVESIVALSTAGTRVQVRVATTTNVNLSSGLEAGDTIDGVTLVAGDRVLVWAQTDPTENGVYEVPASGAASRVEVYAGYEIYFAMFVAVVSGDDYGASFWISSADTDGVIDEDPINFTRLDIAGEEFVALAQAWAEGTEPGGPGTKSSKEWAEESEGFRDEAEEFRDESEAARDTAVSSGDAAVSAAAGVAALTAAFLEGTNHEFDYTGDGVEDTFDTGVTIPDQSKVFLIEDGIVQKPGRDFTVSGSSVVRTSVPADGADAFGYVMLPDTQQRGGAALVMKAAAQARAERLGWPNYGRLDFVAMPNVPLPPWMSHLRGGDAWAFGPNRDLIKYEGDEVRHAFDPETGEYLGICWSQRSRTNHIRNNTMQGASAPSTPPTNWDVVDAAGMSREIVGVGTHKGMPYVDIRWHGTANANAAYIQSMEAIGQIAAANGQTWTISAAFHLIEDAIGNLPTTRLAISQYSSGGSNLGTLDSIIVPTTTFQRFAATLTLNQASTASVRPRFYFSITNGTTYDFTLRIAIPQCEQAPGATTPVLTEGSAVTAPGEVPHGEIPTHLFNAEEFTVQYRAIKPILFGGEAMWSLSNEVTSSEQVRLYLSGGFGFGLQVIAGGSVAANIGGGALNAGQEFCIATRVKKDTFRTANGGAFVAEDTNGSLPSGLQPIIAFGHVRVGSNLASGEHYFRQLSFIPLGASDAGNDALSRLTPA